MDAKEFGRAGTSAQMERILYEVKKIVVGQDHFLERVMVGMLAQGHLLVEGVPGLAKTLTVKTLARTIRAASAGSSSRPISFRRIWRYPHLQSEDGDFATSLGPVFTNLLLADEINARRRKCKARCWKSGKEYQVTIAGETHRVPSRSWSWRPRTRSRPSARTRCPRRRSTAS